MRGERKKRHGTILWSIAVVIITSPLCLIFIYFGEPGRGRAAWLFLGVLLVAIKVRWELRRYAWFWGTIALIGMAETLMVMFVPWTSKWIPAVVMLPFCIIDGLSVLWVFQTVERWMAPSDSG